MKPPTLLALLATSILSLLTGCAINRDIQITSTPNGASVYAASLPLGKTPLITDIDTLYPNRASDFQITATRTLIFKLDGYHDQRLPVSEFNTPDVIHVTLTPLDQPEPIQPPLNKPKRVTDPKSRP